MSSLLVQRSTEGNPEEGTNQPQNLEDISKGRNQLASNKQGGMEIFQEQWIWRDEEKRQL